MVMLIIIGIIVVIIVISKINNIFTENKILQRKHSDKINECIEIKENLKDCARRNEKLNNDLIDIKKNYSNKCNELHNKINKMESERLEVRNKVKNDIEKVLSNKNESQKWLAGMIADVQTIEDEYIARFLENKKHPAIKKAQDIRIIRREKKELIEQLKIFEYQFEYLKSLFPDLSEYLENPDYSNENKKDIEIDPIKEYLTKDEYNTLDDLERNQKALNNYWNRKKSNWQIGRDFERYVGYLYESKGYNVEYFGIEKKLEDLGRDLITENQEEINIVQCKYWASEKRIREKHIFQLYGTSIMFMMRNPDSIKKVKSVFYSHCPLSDEAKEVAEYLNIIVHENIKLERYPIIKCNIGNNEFGEKQKIYHLPMDQQYDKTIIDTKKGEFYCLTVEEAENNGFRRAYRWSGNDIS